MFSKIAINWRGGYHVIPTPCSDTQLRLDISDEFRRCLEALGEPKLSWVIPSTGLSFCGKPWANMAPHKVALEADSYIRFANPYVYLNNLNVMLVLYVMFEVCSLLLLLQSTICCRFNLNLNLHAAFES